MQDLHVSLSPLLLRSRTLPHISALRLSVLGPALLLQASKPRNSLAQQLRFKRVRASALRGKRGVADSCTARSLNQGTGVTHWRVKVCNKLQVSQHQQSVLLRACCGSPCPETLKTSQMAEVRTHTLCSLSLYSLWSASRSESATLHDRKSLRWAQGVRWSRRALSRS